MLHNLDSNASFGVSEYVQNALIPYIGDSHNPNAVHRAGQRSRALIEEAREQIARLLRISQDYRIVFTSGATESNNMALHQLLSLAQSQRRMSDVHFVTTAIEHPSLLEKAATLSAQGIGVSLVSPDETGTITPSQILLQCQDRTQLVSVMLANNETGQILPLAEIARAVRARLPKTMIHTDAVQAVGKMPVRFDELGVDMMSISAHKIGGLTGAGALIVPRDRALTPLLLGGPQEMHLRAGTENVLGILSFGFAAQELLEIQEQRVRRMGIERAKLLETISREIPDARLTNHSSEHLPNTLSIRFPGVRADDLVVALDREGICVSSGAACASGKPEPSHVLLAYGISPEAARETIRISTRGTLSEVELREISHSLIRCVLLMRQQNPQHIEGQESATSKFFLEKP